MKNLPQPTDSVDLSPLPGLPSVPDSSEELPGLPGSTFETENSDDLPVLPGLPEAESELPPMPTEDLDSLPDFPPLPDADSNTTTRFAAASTSAVIFSHFLDVYI